MAAALFGTDAAGAFGICTPGRCLVLMGIPVGCRFVWYTGPAVSVEEGVGRPAGVPIEVGTIKSSRFIGSEEIVLIFASLVFRS